MRPTVTWHCLVETIARESKGADCYLRLFCLHNVKVCGRSDGTGANDGRGDCCGRSQQGPSENGQSGGGNVGLLEISAHFSPVTESVLMYDHFLVTLAI